MAVYYKKKESTHPDFGGRAVRIGCADEGEIEVTHIPVPDTVVLCNGCNKNQYPEPVYMVYLSKNDLKANRAYDCYCWSCLKKYFPKAIQA